MESNDTIDLEKLRQFFLADRFAMDAGISLDDAKRGFARCTMEIQPRHLNAGNGVQGGAIFTLGDFAFAAAANAGQPLTVSLSNQISFLKPVKGHRLTAEASCVTEGKNTCFYRVTITDDLGTPVAEMTVNGFIKR